MILLLGAHLTALNGCVSRRNTKIILRPMLDHDYHPMPLGSTYTSPVNGHFVSDDYLADAFDASVEEIKK